MASDQNKIFKVIAKYFLQGLFYIVPIVVTIYVLFYLVVTIDGLLNLDVPGLGILIILIFVLLVGYLASTYFINYFRPFERAIEKTPLIKIIYSSMKDMMNAFVGSKKQFQKPVLVKINNESNVERLGFITKEDLSEFGILGNKVAVYLPFSYAISGEVLIVPKESVKPINASAADVMKLIISGGVTSIQSTEKVEDLLKEQVDELNSKLDNN